MTNQQPQQLNTCVSAGTGNGNFNHGTLHRLA
jgi:hypothetical protein